MNWAPQIGSSDFRAISDDAAKDDESVSFLATLPLAQQAEWLTRLGWFRLADRLSENQLLEPQYRRFDVFRAEWRAFAVHGVAAGEYESVWRDMQATWFAPSGEMRDVRAVAAWDEYLDALGGYTRSGLEIATIEDHDRMLRRLTGNLCQLSPYLRDEQRDAAAQFGMLDQMMNNLRDMAEDASLGLCFFPSDVLTRFAVSRGSILNGSAIDRPGYHAMMRYWVDEHLEVVRAGTRDFTRMDDLHPSLVRMREAFLNRYAHIERVFRRCSMNYLEFPRLYWSVQPLPRAGQVA